MVSISCATCLSTPSACVLKVKIFIVLVSTEPIVAGKRTAANSAGVKESPYSAECSFECSCNDVIGVTTLPPGAAFKVTPAAPKLSPEV